MRSSILATVIAFCCVVDSATAQEVRSPRDVATGQATGFVEASNFGDIQIDIVLQSVGGATARDVATGQASGKRQHLPMQTRAGIWMSFEHMDEPLAAQATHAVIEMKRGAATCRARVVASYKAATKRLELKLGDANRFFGSDGKPVASLCNG